MSQSMKMWMVKCETLQPYHFQRTQILNEAVCPCRENFVRLLLQHTAVHPDFATTDIFMNVCTFAVMRHLNATMDICMKI